MNKESDECKCKKQVKKRDKFALKKSKHSDLLIAKGEGSLYLAKILYKLIKLMFLVYEKAM